MQRRHFLAAAGCAAVHLAGHAQALPASPIRIVVGFPPGGGTDVVTRVIAQKLGVLWKQTVVVENKAGAAGVIAAEYVAKQPADGTTLLMTNFSNHAVAPSLYPNIGYVVERDFTPIMLVGVAPSLLVCRPDQAARTVRALVERCRAQPGAVTFGSAGPGSAQHLSLEMFKLRADIQALHVPYRGSAPMITDLLGGQIDYSFETMTSATPHVASGKLVAIAQPRPRRAAAHPGVPTLAELGYPGFDASTWYGLAGPGKMPPALVQRMNEDFNKVLAMPDVAEKLLAYGAEDGGGSAGQFASFIASEKDKWAKVIHDAKVTV
ncbi:tripartite tricarboxylate transporter substrate binding protein [Variovorax sp. J2P1-59]|uniref:Bug family tripartite tricarboxylate transporter substrate binding protein n=1 Tax=Variovorax flavidus TaxID=3053501 RepID=UPI002578B73A|nr:tripartite tricarboxylate transporter substrate binding protein [Variovorax sp. J2P1-59]MDM0078084.1 tripartite tricarboxylate transporter substrate binding protein [Variovorax sp. J2P1-59]